MSKSKKTFFFILFFSITLLTLANPARGQIASPTITADHLTVQVGNFQGTNTWGTQKQIQCYAGGSDLLNFENLGQVSYDPVHNQILYKSVGTFGLEAIIYSTVSPQDVDPGFTVNKINSVTFLTVDKYTWVYDGDRRITNYQIEYREVDFEIENTHKYVGYFPFDLSINNLVGFSGEIQLGEYTFQMPEMTYDITSLKTTSIDHSKAGIWENQFIDYNEHEEGSLTIESATEQSANQEVMDYINNEANIGWHKGFTGNPTTLQNYMVFSNPATQPKRNDDGSYSFNINFGLQPEITETRQFNSYTYARINWDYLDTWLISPAGMWITSGPSTKPLERVVAININNEMFKYELEIEVEFYMTVQPDHVLSSEELDDPFYESGDWVWDTTFQGEVPVLAEDTGEYDLLNDLFAYVSQVLWMFIMAFGAIVVIIVYFKTRMMRRN